MTAPEDRAGKIVAEILAGRLDGHLADINQGIRERILSGRTSLRWVIRHPKVEVREDDLTLDEAERIERATGLSWASIDPYTSARECRAILAVALVCRAQMTSDEAADLSGKLTVTEVTDMLGTYEVPAGPLPESGPGEPAGPQTET